ncbi:MAG: DUF192 domain-containing protein [Candidatus Portnoybacteria bacterium]|nr:DUF192 domain-containing protein [Candidatus Portnoybacteria bacterium]
MNKFSIFLIFVVVAALIIFGFVKRPQFYSQVLPEKSRPADMAQKEIIVGDQKISVEIADTAEKRKKGLSGRDPLTENEGMLFIFDESGIYGFWMKEMKFSLDLIWVDGDKIVDITKDVPAPASDSEELKVYNPSQEINKVLEVNAGWAGRHNIKMGDRLF